MTVNVACSITGGLIVNPLSQDGKTVVLAGPPAYRLTPGTPGIGPGTGITTVDSDWWAAFQTLYPQLINSGAVRQT